MNCDSELGRIWAAIVVTFFPARISLISRRFNINVLRLLGRTRLHALYGTRFFRSVAQQSLAP